MEPQEYELMYRIERTHWWYRGMEAITRAILDRWIPPGSQLDILDAGCGTGAAMTTYLTKYGRVTGVDISRTALGFSKMRAAGRIFQASVLDLPFPAGSFGLVTSFDVLYERAVADDDKAIREFNRLLVTGGRLLLRLPAYDWLRGAHDRVTHTARRYDKLQLVRLLERNGFLIEQLSYANSFLFPFALMKRLLERLRPQRSLHSDLAYSFGPFDGWLYTILKSEAHFVIQNALPYGLSLFALGRKVE